MTANGLRGLLPSSRDNAIIHSFSLMLEIKIIMLGLDSVLRKNLSATLSRSTITLLLIAWDRSIRSRRIQKGKCRLQNLSPRQQSSIIKTIHDGTLDMSQHLDIVVVLDVTALQQRHAPIDDSELRMECSKDRQMEVDNLEINIGDLARWGKFHFPAGVLVLMDAESVFPCLLIYQPCLTSLIIGL